MISVEIKAPTRAQANSVAAILTRALADAAVGFRVDSAAWGSVAGTAEGYVLQIPLAEDAR